MMVIVNDDKYDDGVARQVEEHVNEEKSFFWN